MEMAIRFQYLIAVFAALLCVGRSVRLFGSPSWLKLASAGKQQSRSSLTTSPCFTIRGGATSDKSEGKIEGVCIGIDLGTTYR